MSPAAFFATFACYISLASAQSPELHQATTTDLVISDRNATQSVTIKENNNIECCYEAVASDRLLPQGPEANFYPSRRASSSLYIDSWVDAGIFGNADSPGNRFNGPLTFADRANEFNMSQLYLAIGRDAKIDPCSWNLGGRVDLLYGTDYLWVSANGLETYSNGNPRWNSSDGPRWTPNGASHAAMYGLAMPQLYGEIASPMLGGLKAKAGHFYSPLGLESAMAVDNFFNTRSYSYMYGLPKTLTGFVLEKPILDDRVKLSAGFTQGWDNWENTSGQLDFLGGATLESADKKTSLSFNLITGGADATHPEGDRTTYALVFKTQLTKKFSYAFEHVLGTEDNARQVRANSFIDAQWYGINQHFIYCINSRWALGYRVEWFQDFRNSRVYPLPVGQSKGCNFIDMSLGLDYTPRSWFSLRSELRWDHSNISAPAYGVDGLYDEFTKKNQFLFSIDMLVQF